MEDRNKHIDDAVKTGIENGVTQRNIKDVGKELEELVNSRETNDIEK